MPKRTDASRTSPNSSAAVDCSDTMRIKIRKIVQEERLSMERNYRSPDVKTIDKLTLGRIRVPLEK